MGETCRYGYTHAPEPCPQCERDALRARLAEVERERDALRGAVERGLHAMRFSPYDALERLQEADEILVSALASAPKGTP